MLMYRRAHCRTFSQSCAACRRTLQLLLLLSLLQSRIAAARGSLQNCCTSRSVRMRIEGLFMAMLWEVHIDPRHINVTTTRQENLKRSCLVGTLDVIAFSLSLLLLSIDPVFLFLSDRYDTIINICLSYQAKSQREL